MRKLVIVEGLPCSGKSTASVRIADELGMLCIDEGTGSHPADYEFHAYMSNQELKSFSDDEADHIISVSEKTADGFIIPLSGFDGALFDRLLKYKIYDFLPWEQEYPLMLEKWRQFVKKSAENENGYVFNCVFLQNPMCETMMRFGFRKEASEEYIKRIYDIIRPLDPFVVYLKSSDVRSRIEAALPERGKEWLDAVVDYHCNGAYGKANQLTGFEGYISALEERQRRELEILSHTGADHIMIVDPDKNWEKAYNDILSAIKI